MPPNYEYRCEKGHTFEKTQRITDEPIKECPINIFAGSNCSAIKICHAPCKRQLFPVSFQLTGTGWSKDGYSSSGSKKKTTNPI